ncbi:hypothetical protein B0A55_07561 [Friedmanniomyces simplex]|uniref:Uncharacterized protein n=1 Tax=Friedmanniomyces simplex TaxID=329884 RepID=A0A4U0X864_9PEZI|nr:hypothetical protein B0A55_07561 [Friedmanniomyces simplex]
MIRKDTQPDTNGTNSAPNPTSNALGSSITSFYSWTYGPFAGADLYTWSQWITPTIIGTVVVTINEATNKTYSTTVFNEEYTTNGETKILTRTDTNAAGTVTQTLGSATLFSQTPIAVSQGPTTSGGQVVGPSPSGSSPTVAATSSDAATTIASALVFGGITASPVVVTVAATESSANSDQGISPATQYVVAGQTLKPGSSITIRSGSATTVVALPTDTSQTYLVVGSSTSTVEQQPAAPSALVFEGITASPIAVVATTADSTSTAGLPGGSNTAGPATQYVVASQTLVPGSTITVGSGGATTVVALQTDSSQTFLIVGSSTSTIGQQQISGTPPAFTIGSSVIAANSESQYLIDSRTLVPGGSAITVSGTVISLASGATEVVIGTSIEEITSGLGGYIWSGLGAGPTASSAAVGSTSGSSSPGSMSTSAGIAVQTSAGMQAYMADNLIAVAGAVITLICLRI